MGYTYVVTITPADGLTPDLQERFARCAEHQLGLREEREGFYPGPGKPFDIMDAFSGPYVWEMSDAEFEANPPSIVALDIVSVDPAEPAGDGEVRVTMSVAH